MVTLLDRVYLFNSISIGSIATEAPYCVGWIKNGSALSKFTYSFKNHRRL